MSNKILIIIFALGLGFFGCSDSSESVPIPSELDLPNKYSYELTISCFCLTSYVGPHKITVENEVIVDYELLSDEETDENIDIAQFSIPSLVERVNEFIAQDPVTQNIELHPDYNFPVKTYFDVDERLADEEWGYEIKNFIVEEE